MKDTDSWHGICFYKCSLGFHSHNHRSQTLWKHIITSHTVMNVKLVICSCLKMAKDPLYICAICANNSRCPLCRQMAYVCGAFMRALPGYSFSEARSSAKTLAFTLQDSEDTQIHQTITAVITHTTRSNHNWWKWQNNCVQLNPNHLYAIPRRYWKCKKIQKTVWKYNIQHISNISKYIVCAGDQVEGRRPGALEVNLTVLIWCRQEEKWIRNNLEGRRCSIVVKERNAECQMVVEFGKRTEMEVVN